ncbi:MAG: hypothetical protein M0026_08175 [Nocardiopsaceae bacterium]|nr:hypothetical protein [Nocardiopsaceae bacterium]
MADEHHDDHGNTVAAWFLTLSWIVAWTVASVAIIFGGDLLVWTAIGLGVSIVCAVAAGVMKQAGLGRTAPRPVPPTREEWEAARAQAEQARTDTPDAKDSGSEEAAVAAK